MSRECRRVPADWQHPRDEDGDYIPLLAGSFATAAAGWKLEFARWEAGATRDWSAYPAVAFKPREADDFGEFWEHNSPPGPREGHMPEFAEGAASHFQMYETCSEGTPISPVFATPEELAHWCADNGASAFGSMTATYESWLRVARGGYAPSAVMDGRGMTSGVQALADAEVAR